ncbi:MAG: Cys-tRNA(Pro) deacylase [Prevotellaceae bacterium]|jgi:Cys-tRNA(Pro)/Cys-tRNA(Cys) deacylase|nr:Cys-tRNA(Pro) deacylase [Prevotellaceae bacterium]
MKTNKTNAARLLDKAGIHYKLISYKVNESDLSAVHVAGQLGEPVEQVFKTLVLKGDKSGYFVCIIPGNTEVNLKLAAKISSNKNCAMIAMKDLLPVTGYIRGACSPVGMKKLFPSYIHSSCINYPTIYISAGQRGLQIQIDPNELIPQIKAIVANLVGEY